MYHSNLVFNDMVILYVVIFFNHFYLNVIGAGLLLFLIYSAYFLNHISINYSCSKAEANVNNL